MRNFISLIIGLVLISSSQVFAIGLGKSTLNSKVGQQLSIDLKVIGSKKVDEEQLRFAIAPLDTYEVMGVEFHHTHEKLKLSTTRDQDNNLNIQITSPDYIKEPYVNFIIEMSSPVSRLYKEVSVLLDTPKANQVRNK